MMKACLFNITTLCWIDGSLRLDFPFIDRILHHDARALSCLPSEFFRRFPEYTIQWLKPFSEQCQKFPSTLGYLDVHPLAFKFDVAGIWERRGVVLAWFEAGLPYLYYLGCTRILQNDREVMLLIASNCHPEHRNESFCKASRSLRSDKGFMIQALGQDPALFHTASIELQQDFDVALLVFANASDGYLVKYVTASLYDGQSEFLRQFQETVHQKLTLYDTFLQTTLFGIAGMAGSHCPLELLGQGTETSQHYKRLLAEYLDVPTERQLLLLRRASANMSSLSLQL